MTLKFHGIPVNPYVHPGEAVLNELKEATIYRLDEVLNIPEELEKVKWLIGFNDKREGELNIEWADGVVEITPDGVISHETISSHGRPNLYLILHDDNFVPPGCSRVDKIETPSIKSHFLTADTQKETPKNPEQEKQEKLKALRETFLSNPGTRVRVRCEMTNRLYKLFHRIKPGEELLEIEYINGDLVMETTEAVLGGVTRIIDLWIVDTKAGLSGPSKVDNIEDLRSILSIMDEQRKTESKRRSEAA